MPSSSDETATSRARKLAEKLKKKEKEFKKTNKKLKKTKKGLKKTKKELEKTRKELDQARCDARYHARMEERYRSKADAYLNRAIEAEELIEDTGDILEALEEIIRPFYAAGRALVENVRVATVGLLYGTV